MGESAKDIFDRLGKEEKELELSSFSRQDALKLGLAIIEKGKSCDDPITVEITVNGFVVFRFADDGVTPDSGIWLTRKKNSVELMHMSSLRYKYWLEMTNQVLTDRKINPGNYSQFGGGFPINLKGTGTIGSVCISGLPNDTEDHEIIVNSIRETFF